MNVATWPVWLIAVVVAQAEERRKRREEEDMTPYTDAELAEGFEFKILRSVNGAFRKPEFLSTAVAAEGRAGWVLVEKFDNRRVRMKRPRSASKSDAGLDFDPYRTRVGVSELRYTLTILAIMLAILAAIGGAALLVESLVSR